MRRGNPGLPNTGSVSNSSAIHDGAGSLNDALASWEMSTHFMDEGVLFCAPWLTAAIGSGTIGGLAVASHPGIFRITALTAAASGARTISASQLVLGSTDLWTYECTWRTPPAFTISGVNVLNILGLGVGTTIAEPGDGIYAFFGAPGDGTFYARTIRGGSFHTTELLATLAVSTWYRIAIDVDMRVPKSRFRLYSDAGVVLADTTQTASANFPTGTMRTGAVLGTASAAAAGGVVGDLDAMRLIYRKAN